MDDRKRIAEDVNIIKSTLEGDDGRLLLPPWAFFSWAAVTAAATGVSFLLYRFAGLSGTRLVLYVWVPALAAGTGLETAGWIAWLRKEELVLRAEWMQRMILSFCGIVAALIVLGVSLSLSGADLAGYCVLSLSICFMALAIFSWKQIFIEAYLLLAAGTLLMLFAGDGTAAYLAAGGICSAGFAAAGLHSGILDRRRNG